MKKISIVKLIISFYKLPGDIRGSLYTAIVTGVKWGDLYYDKKRNKRRKKSIKQC